MSNSDIKKESNKSNAQHSTGPKDTDKTKYNALEHGLCSDKLTELDTVDFNRLLNSLKESIQPVGPLESFLVEKITVHMVKMKRANALEADYIISILHPKKVHIHNVLPDGKLEIVTVIDEGKPAKINPEDMDEICSKFQRYETSIENKFYKALNQLERLQRSRKGEFIPAPVAMDIGFVS